MDNSGVASDLRGAGSELETRGITVDGVPELAMGIDAIAQSCQMLRNRSLIAVSLAAATSFVGLGMVVPVRVLYVQSRGASLAIIGAMASAYLLSSFAFQYPTGQVADLWGRRRVMIVGLLLQSLFSLLYLAVTDPVLFVALRFCEGAAAASVMPSARALGADVVEPERRGQAYGLFSSFFNAGFLLGPALGGLFAAFGYAPAFIGSCSFRLLGLSIVVLLVHADGRRTAEDRERAQAVPRSALFTLPLIGAYLLTFSDNLYFGFDLTLLPLWMRHHLGATITIIGLTYVVWALPNIIGSPFGGRIADRMRRAPLIHVFGLGQVPMYVTYGLANWWLPVVALFAVHGAIYSLMQPAVDAHLAAASPPDARARAQRLYTAIGLGGGFISSLVMPALYAVSFRLPQFALAGGFGMCVLIGGTLVRRAERRGMLPALRREAAAQD